VHKVDLKRTFNLDEAGSVHIWTERDGKGAGNSERQKKRYRRIGRGGGIGYYKGKGERAKTYTQTE